MRIRLIVRWGRHKAGDEIEVTPGIGRTLIERRWAVESKMGHVPSNRMLKPGRDKRTNRAAG